MIQAISKATASNFVLQLSDTSLLVANGHIIPTLALAEDFSFQLGSHNLQAAFVVLASDCWVDAFLLGRNFLHKYNVLVDLTARKIVIRNPLTPKFYKPKHQVSDGFSMIMLNQEVTFGPYERRTVQAKVITENPDEFARVPLF